MNAVQSLSIAVQKRFGRQRLRRILLGTFPFIALLVLWRMNTVNEWLPPVYIPPMATII